MTALIIICAFLITMAAILYLPIAVNLAYKDEFVCKVYLLFFKVFDSTKEPKPKRKKKKTAESSKTAPKKENALKTYFKKLKENYGFSGAVKEAVSLAKQILFRIKGFLGHIRFKSVKLDITVSSQNAASTAIEYGAVCSAVYPLLSLLESFANIDYKQINISSDFEKTDSSASFSAAIKTNVIYGIITALKIYSDIKEFKERIEKDER